MAYGYEIFLKDGISGVANNISKSYGFMSNKIINANKSIDNSINKTKEVFTKLSASIGLDPAAAMEGLGVLRDASIEAFSDIEKKQKLLTNTLQSSSAAKIILGDVQAFANNNKLALKETEDAYISLLNHGFAPTMEEFKKFSDVAASKDKSVGQLAEAMLSAEAGKFDQLYKEFGILLEKKGDDGIVAKFKGITKNIGSDAKDIRKYLMEIGDTKGIAGATDAVAKTATGYIVGIKNHYQDWLRQIGAFAAPINSAFGVMSAAWTALKVMREAAPIVFNAIGVGLSSVWTGMKAAYLWTVNTGNAFGVMGMNAIKSLLSAFSAVGGLVVSLVSATAAQFGLNFAMSASPIGLIVMGVAALAAAFYGLFRLIDSLFPGFFKGVSEWFKKAFDFIYMQFVKPIVDFFGWLFESAMPKVAGADAGDEFSAWQKNGNEGKSVYDFLNSKSKGGEIESEKGGKEKVKKGVSDKIENSGHGGIKNITINIGKLVEQMHFHTNNMTENADKIKEQVIRLLLDATNQVNYQ
jgi:hypothetical protein